MSNKRDSRPRSSKLKSLTSTWSESPPGVKLSSDQVDALIEQLQEIARANIDLIAEAEASRAESELVRKRSLRLQWTVSVAFIVGALIALSIWQTIGDATADMEREVESAEQDFKVLNDNVALTLGVVRSLSEAQAAKVKADVDMDEASEADAIDKADKAQRKAVEAETKIQKDPAKKADAEQRLKKYDAKRKKR